MKKISLVTKQNLAKILNLLAFDTQKIAKNLSLNPKAFSAVLEQKCAAISNDSRELEAGDIFFALDGVLTKGEVFIPKALELNAKAIFVEADTNYIKQENSSWIFGIENLNGKMGKFLAELLQIEKSENFAIYAITGTNGKTSVANFLVQAWQNLGFSAKFIGTIGMGDLENLIPSDNTTPDLFVLYNLLYTWKNQGVQKVVMEASSHALVQKRLAGLKIKTAVFTNLSQDHLDYHHSMQEYGAAKRLLFSDYSAKNAVLNLDDEFGKELFNQFKNKLNCVTYSSLNAAADLYLSKHNLDLKGITADLAYKDATYKLETPVIGEFNFANIASVLGVLLAENIAIETALTGIQKLKPVLGRMHLVKLDSQPKVIVDYAHTPDALEKALKSVKAHCTGSLICVFGAGGDRDKGKRSQMAKVAQNNADNIYITDDNPRTEDAQNIRKDILAGLNAKTDFVEIGDRRKAIQTAIKNAAPNDWILIAGKGHEDYQIIGKTKQHFSDIETALEFL